MNISPELGVTLTPLIFVGRLFGTSISLPSKILLSKESGSSKSCPITTLPLVSFVVTFSLIREPM